MKLGNKISAQDFQAGLIERIKRTPSVESFRFKPRNKINFIPGQFLEVKFDPVNKSNRQLNKYLSFSSSPHQDYIEVTKRITESEFSKRLKALSLADIVSFRGPMGNCVYSEEYKKICFLVGGIGITPVISMLGYIWETRSKTDIILLYSNKNYQEIAFKKELDYWQKNMDNIKIVYTITECQPEDENCLYGCIDKDLVISKINDIEERVLFSFGPPGMVENMKNICEEGICRPKAVITENFAGY
ncbi:MAG: FAD-dependent oxidoreductase [Candidatus Omnitrophica bacterium]|nr:FAD-dependent oxidoreductase [Candidatus Omnitrophota bacterium]